MRWFLLLAFAMFFAIPFFWLPIHAAVAFWRRLGKRSYYLGVLVWGCSVWLFLAHADFWLDRRVPRGVLTCAAGLALISVEAAITRKVGAVMGLSRLVGRHEIEPGRFAGGFLQHGIYARVRHPRYLGAMCALFGLALLAGSRNLLIAAAASVPLFCLMTGLEERELETRFGDEYRSYRRRVPRFLPRLWQ